MGNELKSTLDIVMNKLKGMDEDIPDLNDKQRERIAEIRKKYEAKVAEAKILLKNSEELPAEIARLEEKRDEEIKKVYKEK